MFIKTLSSEFSSLIELLRELINLFLKVHLQYSMFCFSYDSKSISLSLSNSKIYFCLDITMECKILQILQGTQIYSIYLTK